MSDELVAVIANAIMLLAVEAQPGGGEVEMTPTGMAVAVAAALRSEPDAVIRALICPPEAEACNDAWACCVHRSKVEAADV